MGMCFATYMMVKKVSVVDRQNSACDAFTTQVLLILSTTIKCGLGTITANIYYTDSKFAAIVLQLILILSDQR
jgi:hypothetical protein